MIRTPQPAPFAPATDILDIADMIADPVEGADFPQTRLRFRNDRWAASVGLDALTDKQWIAHFGRFAPLPGSLPQPLALRYHGHQFRVYNPEIGDGRGFLFAQLRDSEGRLLDLGTKGSGQTPYSRFGDGRLTLKGAVREILATEMLEALGVETSKTFSVIETGEELVRGDEPSPTRSAVLFRLSHSHIRIGSFQRLATLGDDQGLRRLTAYALEKLFGEEGDGDDAPVRLLSQTVMRTADLAASYMIAGFVHGVLNSDNINVTGESFDYGPWRFAPTFDPSFTAAYFDQSGLYAFARQAEAIHWDVVQLASALARISKEDAVVEAVNGFAPAYRDALVRRMLWRLGVVPQDEATNIALVRATEAALIETKVEIDRFYFDWVGGRLRQDSPASSIYAKAAFADFRTAIGTFSPVSGLDHSYWQGNAACSMHIEEVETIWTAIAQADDWQPLETKVADIRTMGAAMLRLGTDGPRATNH
jgi:serine/tyrosine/threonine adenylyltransferase